MNKRILVYDGDRLLTQFDVTMPDEATPRVEITDPPDAPGPTDGPGPVIDWDGPAKIADDADPGQPS